MKSRILDPKFQYTPAAATSIQDTWRKFGWKPQNEMSGLRSVDTSEVNPPERRVRPQVARVR
jgi:hypothetical protein